MASEMINQVLDVEKNAAEKEKAARAKAAEIVKEAEAEAQATVEAGKAAAANEREQLLGKAHSAADKIFADARQKAAVKKDEFYAASKEKQDESVEAVIKHIIP